MLIILLRRHLRPYVRQVALVSALLFVQTIANLYLPNLNADIINNGVVKGNIRYIWTTGGLMLAITAGALGGRHRRRLLGVDDVDGRGPRHARRRLQPGATVLGARDEPLRHAVAHHPQHQRRPADPDLPADGADRHDPAPIMCVGGVIMALREDVTLSALLLVVVPLMVAFISWLLINAVPQFRSMQVKIDRINQVLREQITGVRVIRAFVRTRHEEERFEDGERRPDGDRAAREPDLRAGAARR